MFFVPHHSVLSVLPVRAAAKVFSLAQSRWCCSHWHNTRTSFQSKDQSAPSSTSRSLSLSLLYCLFPSCSLSLPLPLRIIHTASVSSSQVSSAALYKCTHRCRFQRSARDGITIKSHACESGSAMMKRFVAIVLRGLVSISKENPIWPKEHHRPPKKEIRRKRRAVKRATTMGRCNLAVGIPPVVSELDHWSLSFLRCQHLNAYSQDVVVSIYVTEVQLRIFSVGF